MAIYPVAQTDAAKVATQAAAAQTATANVNQAPAVAKEQTPAKPQTAITDTVQISSSASALMQEVQETAAQTAQEAGRGDRQAQRLLAKEEAARAEQQGSNKAPTLSMK